MSAISEVKRVAARMIELDQRLADLNNQLAAVTSERDEIRLVELPRMMDELEIDNIGVGNLQVSIVSQVEASLPKDPAKRERALNWLYKHGHKGAIKRKMNLDLPNDNDAVEMQIQEFLDGLSITPVVEHGIHFQTYKALCREIVRSGEVAPLEDLGIYIGRIAKVDSK
jgi:hypothetical protein